MTIAFWCVLVAALLPYVAFSFVKGADPNYPRDSVKNFEGRSARAYAAHLNAFEAFAPFAAAVIISHLALGGANTWTNILAILFLIARVAHLACYLNNLQPARSIAWFIGLLLVILMFVHAAWG